MRGHASADVLTFYQERIANEGFLRTATERRSILELARLIGYELNPGVAASVYLAYHGRHRAGRTRAVVVAAGTQVQSVPGQDELPQTFETSADLLRTCRVERAAAAPAAPADAGRQRRQAVSARDRRRRGQGAATLDVAETHPLDLDTPLPSTRHRRGVEVETLYVAGTTTNLKAGDVVLLVGRRDEDSPPQTLTRTIRRVQEEDAQGRTRVDFDAAVLREPRWCRSPGRGDRVASGAPRSIAVGHPCRRQPVVERSRPDRVDERAGLGPRAALDYIYTAVNNPRRRRALAPGDARRVRDADARWASSATTRRRSRA